MFCILQKYADDLNIPFIETSAKNSDNVEQAFLEITSALIKSRYINSVY